MSFAAPFTPASDAEVVEKLPGASDPAVRAVESLRRQLLARPQDDALRIEIARRYFGLAMAQGDPRFVGYASAAIAPLERRAPTDAKYWLVRGQLQQYNHDFAGALQSLARSAELDPTQVEPLAWRAAIFMVQARYPEALAECDRLRPLAHPAFAVGCRAYAQAATGQLAPSYQTLSAAAASADVPAELALWLHTRLAEMALRLQRPQEAEKHFKTALAQGITDQFLLGAYADFLISQSRGKEALTLLAGWERSDVLLLRLAFAGRAVNDPRAGDWTRQLKSRFDEAAARGDRLHEQEAARFALEVQRDPALSLKLAISNYQAQKEPRDAEVLLRAALAAKQPQAARPALEWLASSRYEDPALAALARELEAAGTKR